MTRQDTSRVLDEYQARNSREVCAYNWSKYKCMGMNMELRVGDICELMRLLVGEATTISPLKKRHY